MMHAMQVVLAKAVACWYDVSMQTISLHTRISSAHSRSPIPLQAAQLRRIHPNSSNLLIVFSQSNHL